MKMLSRLNCSLFKILNISFFIALIAYHPDANAVQPQVATGGQHTLGLKYDGTVVAVGDNYYGESDVSGWDNIRQIEAGSYHSVGLKSDGTVEAVSSNIYGQCDVDTWTNVKQVVAGGFHTIGLKHDGTVIAVGYNSYGQCDVTSWTDIQQVAAGLDYTIGLKSDGTVVAVGDNYYGQCNVDSWENIKQVACNLFHTVGLRANGTVVAVGWNDYGQCEVSGLADIQQVAAGHLQTVLLRSNHTVVTVGWTGIFDDISGWTDIKQIAVGSSYRGGAYETVAVGLKYDGTVVADGHDYSGQCDVEDWNLGLFGVDATRLRLVSGGAHTVGVRQDGTVIADGNNSYGQCNVSSWTDIVQVSVGGYHTFGLKPDGTVLAVGSNSNGQCFQTQFWTDIEQVAAGTDSVYGLKTDGTVVVNANNQEGQEYLDGWTDVQQISIFSTGSHIVGLKSNGTALATGGNNYFNQCDISIWTDLIQVSAGGGHTVGLKSDGTVVAVGNNDFGQCNVENWADIIQVSAGWQHTVGLKSDGTVVAVGPNSVGECDVTSWSNIKQISAGWNYTTALQTDNTIVAVGDNSHGRIEVDDWILGYNINIDINNVEGGASELEGTWRVDLYDSNGNPLKQVYSSQPSIGTGLNSGDFSAKIYFYSDTGLRLWEYWGEKEFSVTAESGLVDFTRNMPWLGEIAPWKPSVPQQSNLSVTCSVQNELFESIEVKLEGQIGGGNVISSGTVTIQGSSSANVPLQFNDLPADGVWPLRYWIKAKPTGESDYSITDHFEFVGYLTIDNESQPKSEYLCMDYQDRYGNLWQIGLDYKYPSNTAWFYDPMNTFKNIKYYKNGSQISPSVEELQILLDRIAHQLSIFFPRIDIGHFFDTYYGIWRQPCGFSWACGLALTDFGEYERKVIYKDLIWDAVTCRNHPFLNTEYRVPGQTSYIALALPLKISSYIDSLWDRYASAIGIEVKTLDRMKKVQLIAAQTKQDPALASEIEAESKQLDKTISMLKAANKVGDIALHTVQNIVLMDFLASTGFGQQRIATLKEAYLYVRDNLNGQIDPTLLQAIEEVESELDFNMESLGNTIVSSFLGAAIDDLRDPNYVKQQLVSMVAESVLAKKLVGTVAKNYKVSNSAAVTAMSDIFDGLTTVMALGDDWRRIILSGMLSKTVYLYAQNDPAWLAAAYPSDGVVNYDALKTHQIRDVFDLQSVFSFEYLSRGLGLLDSNWMNVVQDAVDSTLEQATSPPYTYPINYASTAVLFGQCVGTAANGLVFSDALNAARDMLMSIVDDAEKKNDAINQWAVMMANSQRKAMPWIPLLLLSD